MAPRLPLSRRVRTAARWPLGVALTAWRYLWRLTPIERWEWDGSAQDVAPDIPIGATTSDLQAVGDGVGPLLRRTYRVMIRSSPVSPEQLIARLADDLNAVSPSEFASFEKVSRNAAELQLGDEYVVRMPGPWDGPVRVIDRTARSFRFATLDGHLEAGQIEFRAGARDGALEFTIESWARSGDQLSHVMYTKLRLAKEVQLHMWTSVLERVVRLADGCREGPLLILTRRVDTGDDAGGDRSISGPATEGARRALAELAHKGLNFDPAADHRADAGWHVDEVRRELPTEPSGAPVPGGSWETARRLMIDYQVADPNVVRATYRRDVPLAGRDMLLQIRFLTMRLHVGVRIGSDYDELRTVDGRRVRVFGWDYSTLEGHFERGRLHYEVWKWLDSGVVEFRLRAYSRAATSGSVVVRLGFRLIGRTQQLRFYRQAARRIAGLTTTELELARP